MASVKLPGGKDDALSNKSDASITRAGNQEPCVGIGAAVPVRAAARFWRCQSALNVTESRIALGHLFEGLAMAVLPVRVGDEARSAPLMSRQK